MTSPRLVLALLICSGILRADDPPLEDWAKKFPAGEKPVRLFNGKDLTGWEGSKHWTVEDGAIKGANTEAVPSSTYLFTKDNHRNYRLVFEVKQTRSPKHSTMHSAVATLGEKFTDKGDNTFGFKGPLLMFCADWGIWDAHRRNRVAPVGAGPKVEKVGDWNLIEVLVIDNRIRFAANGTMVFDHTDKPDMLKASPLGLQLHANDKPQDYRFRGLILAEKPADQMITVRSEK